MNEVGTVFEHISNQINPVCYTVILTNDTAKFVN